MAILSDSDRKKLTSNPNVEKVTNSHVAYTLKFKLHAIKSYENGVKVKEIFSSAGIDLSLFRHDYAKNTIRRWRRIGKENLKDESRGRNLSTKPKKRNLTQEQEIAQLKAEIWILKKLQASAKKPKK